MNKIIVAPDSFKECMSAIEASAIMKKIINKVDPNIQVEMLPMADGGEGTLDLLVSALSGKLIEQEVTDPIGNKVRSKFGISGDRKTAVVEMAEASGFHLVEKSRRNPLWTTTYGTGQLIKASLEYPLEELIVTIGGSATNDAGVGMLQALGAKIVDKDNCELAFGGGELGKVASIDFSELDPRLKSIKIKVACDVDNLLVGARGATQVFARQKGANEEMVEILEKNMRHFASIVKEQLAIDINQIPGAGAAGGLGGALLLLGGVLQSGIDLVLDTVQFDKTIQKADFILTGEGKIDSQTPQGKVISGITKRASKYNIPVLAFAGSVQQGYEALYDQGLTGAYSITQKPGSLTEALEKGKENLASTVENIVRLISLNKQHREGPSDDDYGIGKKYR